MANMPHVLITENPRIRYANGGYEWLWIYVLPKKKGRYQETILESKIYIYLYMDLSIVYRIHRFLEGYTDRFYIHVVFQSIPISIIPLVMRFSIVIMGLRYSYTNLLLKRMPNSN